MQTWIWTRRKSEPGNPAYMRSTAKGRSTSVERPFGWVRRDPQLSGAVPKNTEKRSAVQRPHSCVVVLDRRQLVCVLRLGLRPLSSPPLFSLFLGTALRKPREAVIRRPPRALESVCSRQVKRLQLAEFEKLLPIAVNFLLGLLNHPLVAGLEHVGEAALDLQVLLHRQLVFGLVA